MTRSKSTTSISPGERACVAARSSIAVDSPPDLKNRLWLGPSDVDTLQAAIAEGGRPAAAHLVRNESIEQFVIVGSPDECRFELRSLMEHHQLDEFQVSVNDLDLADEVLDIAGRVVGDCARYRRRMAGETAPDTLNDVGVLKRREIEARIVSPLLERLAGEFGDRVYEIAGETIVDIAREQGAALAQQMGDVTLPSFALGLGAWSADGALESEVTELSDEAFAFDVTRCRYAEMYRSLGLEELGATMSCNRDGSLIEGFNPNVEFTRTRTIMGGADSCDFRFALRETPVEISD